MCGIIGEISKNKIHSVDWINKAGIEINHRGPDNFGMWTSLEKKIAFAHNRLSIIDLSPNGNQPMVSNCENYVITFNGEIYNYKNLRDKLLEKGFFFKTNTDTEVLLNGYILWGESFLSKIEGMFAFAIYDKKKNIVILARDRAGEKPLYYYKNSTNLSFCSELKGLLKNHKIERKISINNLLQFLHQGYPSNEGCLINNIKKLKAGEYLNYNLDTGKIVIKSYFNLSSLNQNNEINQDSVLGTLENLLNQSVKQQINADVPVGVLLSGGIDSSLITAIASNYKNKVNTFTFLNNKNDNDFELKNSRQISKFFSTNHHEIYYPEVNPSIIYKLSNFIDEPIFDSSIIPTFLISKEIKKYCTVALGGDGGDELFGGYDHYSRLLIIKKINNFLPNIIKKNLSSLTNFSLPIGFRGRNWLNLLGKNLKNDYLDFVTYFDENTNHKILNNKILNIKKKYNYLLRNEFVSNDVILKASMQDFNNFLSGDILAKNDRFSMASSVELRSPFLNSEIIKFAFSNLNSSHKVKKNQKKIILRNLCSKILPKSFTLDKKRGFSIPINDYFNQKSWRTSAQEILLDDSSFFKSRFISNILKKPFFNHNNSERIFGLMMFELWKKKYRVSL